MSKINDKGALKTFGIALLVSKIQETFPDILTDEESKIIVQHEYVQNVIRHNTDIPFDKII